MSTTLSLEDDQLSFLYCFLLLCLDSIIYGLLALAVTKVVDPSPVVINKLNQTNLWHPCSSCDEGKMNLEHLR